jgi:hypothetical protein
MVGVCGRVQVDTPEATFVALLECLQDKKPKVSEP